MSYTIHNNKQITNIFLEIDAINEFDKQLRDLILKYRDKYPKADDEYILGKVFYYLWLEDNTDKWHPNKDITTKYLQYMVYSEFNKEQEMISKKISEARNRKLTKEWYNSKKGEVNVKEEFTCSSSKIPATI